MEGQLKRSIGWGQGTAMAVGSVLGSGILVLPAITAEQAGPASLVSWAIMSLLAMPLAFTLGRLATKVPSAGGIAAYVRQAFGPVAGSMIGWLFLGTVPVGVPIIALVGANYVGVVFHLTNWAMTGIAAMILCTSLILNIRGVELSARSQVLIVSLTAALLIAAVVAASPKVDSMSFHPFLPNGWIPVGMAAVSVFWCFVGWEMVAHLAEEFKNPKRDVFLSLSIAPVLVGILYFSIAFVTVGTRAYGADVGVAPLSILVGIGFGRIGTVLTAFLALLVTFGGLHMNIAGFSRMVYAQSREGDFPKIFAYLHPTYKTPIAALSGLAIVFSVVLTINGYFHPNLGSLIQWPSVVFLVLYIIAMASALKLLRTRTIGWWSALVSLIVCIILYPFTGWAMIYPIILGVVGWSVSVSRSRITAIYPHSTDKLKD